MFERSPWYMRLGTFAFNLVLLNLLWFFFSLLGVFVLGFFPATAALFAVLRQIIMEDEDTSVLKLFWSKFKSEFFMSNVIGYLVLSVGVILYVDIKVLQLLDNNILQLALASITVVIGIVYLLTLLYIFPLFVHFNLTFLQYPKHALILAVAKPFQTIMMIGGLAIVLFLYMNFPVLILVFGMSLISFVMMKVASFSLPRKDFSQAVE
ncbi:YesL family protein [Halalkalibacter kiskunsagensis]|uniref:YesL family protein n=1 Tax=Halalkalibacter kiskunsagensis TaxID=1548599 RepID=A0ABV6KCI8_9BACI